MVFILHVKIKLILFMDKEENILNENLILENEEIFSFKILKEDFYKYKLLSPLLEIHDSPKQLYFKSKNKESLDKFLNKNINGEDYKVLTIVGSRKNSHYGKEVLNYLLKSITGENIIIVSGLAVGIDSISHINAIKNNLPTISVPGSGLSKNVIYPKVNIPLYDEIIETENILISEYEDDRKSELYFFPARNRIMAAISDAVLIVEAGEKSGTLITARLAMEYGKNVGVVPNNIFAEGSVGSNRLMQDGAITILNTDDLLDLLNIRRGEQSLLDLDFTTQNDKNHLKNILEKLPKNEKFILEKILQSGNIEKDILLSEVESEYDISYTDCLVSLMSLEINGFIKEEMGEVRMVR